MASVRGRAESKRNDRKLIVLPAHRSVCGLCSFSHVCPKSKGVKGEEIQLYSTY